MDPFLLCLVLCCIGGLFMQWGVVTDSINWGAVGLGVLAVVAVVVLTTTNWGN